MHTGQIAAGVPVWVWVLLAVLVALGVRRLRTREVPTAIALLPAAAFLGWNLWNAFAFARLAGAGATAVAVLAGAVVGVASAVAVAVPEPRGQRLPGGRVRLPGSALPLLLYLLVFVVRFACGARAAIVPDAAVQAAGIALAVGAGATARLIAGVARWTGAPAPQA